MKMSAIPYHRGTNLISGRAIEHWYELRAVVDGSLDQLIDGDRVAASKAHQPKSPHGRGARLLARETFCRSVNGSWG